MAKQVLKKIFSQESGTAPSHWPFKKSVKKILPQSVKNSALQNLGWRENF
jgi:hypothetical protein